MKKFVALFCMQAALFSVSTLFVQDMKICLTWNTTKDHLYVMCNILSHQYKLVLTDPSGFVRVECFKNKTPNCAAKTEDDVISSNISHTGFSLGLKIDRKNGEGNWKCLHGSEVANVNISLSKGTVHSTDIHIFGEIMKTNESNAFKLTCFSCWIPHTKSVYFSVNDVLQDTVRSTDGKCYHTRELCRSTECGCSIEGNSFTWIYKSDVSNLKFTCEMRFRDEETSKLSIQKAHLFYNETGFDQEVKRTRTVTSPDNDTYIIRDTPDEKEIDSAIAQAKRERIYVIVCTVLVTFTTGIAILSCVYPDIPGLIKEKIIEARCCSGQKGYEKLTESACGTCKEYSNCGVCLDCKEFFCVICCKDHIKKNTKHRVYQCNFLLNSITAMKCKTCAKLAKIICRDCWASYCARCAHNHSHPNMTIIYQSPSGAIPKSGGDVPKILNPVAKMFIQGDSDLVRICGLCYIADGTVVAVDGNNYKLIVFKSNDQQLKEQLEHEPCSMTAMTGNEIAVTFPYQKQIRIYKINLTTTKIIDSKDEPNIIDKVSVDDLRKRKPFSIAYNKGYFAVEVGEGEDGMILIIDICQKKVMKKISCDFAYFTGHTIRLGLNATRSTNNENVGGRLFVSAMSIKMVSCLNLDHVNNEKLWHISDPSPRSIIVPDDDSLGEHIILSSRRSNTIYQLNEKDGSYKSLKVQDNSKINSPRYIAYHSNTNKLCVLVVKDEKNKEEKNVDELCFYEFQNPEQNESSPLVDDNVKDTRI